MVIPGGIYAGDQVMQLGDRIVDTFGRHGPISFFGRPRVRPGILDPDHSPAWTGLTSRKAQLEAGLGAVIVSPVGLWTTRFSSDISGRSRGTELLVNRAAPARPAYDVGNAWSLAPSLIASWRIDRHWLAGVVLAYERFSSPIADSPLIQKTGRHDALVGLGYVWR